VRVAGIWTIVTQSGDFDFEAAIARSSVNISRWVEYLVLVVDWRLSGGWNLSLTPSTCTSCLHTYVSRGSGSRLHLRRL
jgi:hypothetical protein